MMREDLMFCTTRRQKPVLTSRTSSRVPRQSMRGVALPIVLLVTSMMLVTAAAWFESSLLAARSANGVVDHLQAFHAADAALTLCARSLVAGAIPMPADATDAGEPTLWKREALFDAQAITPVSTWPGSARAPQCVIESWKIGTRPAVRAFLLTVRGFGASTDTQSWQQLQLVFDGEHLERHWRRVVARPF